ncbi:hypothetical protein THRCLA_11300, partial [Thraustotheca clavata]
MSTLMETRKEDEDASSDGKENDESNVSTEERKPRRELPPATVAILKTWMLSPDHVKHPYPTDEDKKMLLEKTGINMKQLTNWFTNARKRIWKPMMRREHSRQLQTSFARDPQLREPPQRLPAAIPPPNTTPDSFLHPSEQYPAYPAHPEQRTYHQGIPAIPAMDRRIEYPPRAHEYTGPATSYPAPGNVAYFEPRSHRSVSESVVDRMHHRNHHGYHPYANPRHAIPPSHEAFSLQTRLPPRSNEHSPNEAHVTPPKKSDSSVEKDDDSSKEKRARRSSLLPPHVIRILKDWMMSPEHMEHPYPTDVEKKQLCEETGLDMCQLNNWFANNRKRLWKPTMANRTKERLSQLYSSESIRNIIYNKAPTTTEPRRVFNITQAPPPQPREFKVNDRLPPSNMENRLLPPVSGALPSLIPPKFPPMGVPREGRSHTLDIGHFRRSRMNFQDILNASSPSVVLPPLGSNRPKPSGSVDE